ncbi:hypothetical protein A6302_03032 [Methylobrevis pamukkalensis]|uniref:Acyltransferase family protein n=1 Tax=Methylobrevis pamukkalensis TaxID=1439726 RepID=A0A1E3H046_9HYPH|nr:hypothetical protein A6302_03032 [Methylobrevis pamukkalensis]
MIVERFRIPVRSLLPGLVAFIATCIGMLVLSSPYVVLAGFALATVLTASAERNNPACGRPFRHFVLPGQAAFGIYMLHPVVGAFLMSFGWQRVLGPSGLIPFHLYLVIAVVIVITVALISLRVLEAPLRKAINNRFAPSGKPSPGPAPTRRSRTAGRTASVPEVVPAPVRETVSPAPQEVTSLARDPLPRARAS